ncbi:FAD-dependent monooxygenase [Actinoplanes sp. NPDC051411]|uniref:FAD-dependent monooxygenase n=1 Tax=Actinoplanes sp. NPDC051411 TaxID=3155522 RepID=UPI003421272C
MSGRAPVRLVIAGGGIGGLAAALAASAHGHRVTVLERQPEFTELGAGIQLAPNGLHALDVLGAGPPVRATAVAMAELRFMDGTTGEHVTSMPLTEGYRRRFGRPYVVVHRAELHRRLLDACRRRPGVTLRPSAPVAGYAQDSHEAVVRLKTGERIAADAVIGADGIHSRIRRQMVGDGEPRTSGITAYRAIVPMEQVPVRVRRDAVTWWTGPDCHFVHYPISGGAYLNMAASRHDGGRTSFAGVPVGGDLVRDKMSALGAVRDLLSLTEQWRAWVLLDRPPSPVWTDGRVALLGDAAHAMLHYAAQGACQALEDAVVLGDLLGDAPGDGAGWVPRLLERYADHRRERTAAVQRVSRDSIRLWHAAGAAATARNRTLGAMAPDDLYDAVAWMHAARVRGPRPSRAAR